MQLTVAMLRRYVVTLVMAMWMGGFTFYAIIVIPTAAKVLGSERQVGFITQQVTRWLNLIGVAALLVLLWNVVAGWNRRALRIRYGLVMTWLAMVMAQIGLFITHPLIDRLLDPEQHKVHGYDKFYNLHRVYLILATLQWGAALLYIWLALSDWRVSDRLEVAGK
jgi:hypothetical protein